MGEEIFEKIYQARSAEAQREIYDTWSETYDADVKAQGYATPARMAAALAGVMERYDAPILDFGCGTGLSGAALAGVGFTVIDGVDISEGMMASAGARGVYRDLRVIPVGEPFSVAPGTYGAIAAVGVIGSGAAPLSVLDDLAACLASGGYLTFSFNDHTLEDPAYEAWVRGEVDAGRMGLRHRDYDAHLTGLDMKSAVYILEKS
ncbi:class I SAM-dependent DNA methyltransferase [Ovoidimarina sediminis]|uniref:class I SAM-dependent DNA methyltransferase n=1 Tax=Ovoidimarina sediminis TaxID=3079856 RepID=UPI00290779A0|nr:class I SAM-dependent methyltransferase [Rhodophyticola sp. MJ-SS7]MDU8941976.1 class I SAM-dependent methyltransferase [Rhodophyticola sp. MJ-SS7]